MRKSRVPEESPIMSPKEVCAYLKINGYRLRTIVKSGALVPVNLPHSRLHRFWRVDVKRLGYLVGINDAED